MSPNTTPNAPKNNPAAPASEAAGEHKVSNFLRQIIEKDLEQGTYASRHWAGTPGDAAHHAAGPLDPAKIRTRFPPEPNGYLHVGHAKSICLNFGLARDYGGVCHMRFDDTNPEKEDTEYVNSILDAVQWLGFGWEANGQSHLFQASDYFDFMYRAAEYLVQAGHAYVDEQTAEQMRANRGDFGKPGVDSPFRSRTPAENLARFREMRDGRHEDGSMVLRAKIDMASPNINLRDPAIYRIRRATHHNTGDKWCIYPMYTFAHPIEDALEQITHSICTLEFEDQRPFYDWLMERLIEGHLLAAPAPRQYEFARLNLTYVITSKRKLAQLVYDHKVSGWDDPRMPTIVGLRRRGYTPASIQLFAERIGVTKSDSWIDYSTLEGCLREDLENKAHRGMAVLDPVKLVLTNWAEAFGADDYLEDCTQPALPHSAIAEGQTPPPDRVFKIGNEVWIEREDFEEVPPKGYKRLYPPRPGADGQMQPGNVVRLKGGYVIECTGCAKDASGTVLEVHAKVIPGTKSGTPGADSVKAKAAITWVSVADGVQAEVRLYDRLFSDPQPDAGGKDFIEALNPNSLKVVTAYVEPSLAAAKPDQKFQFERFGYFVADRVDHVAGSKPVFNRVTGLKDSWGK
ncbi:MAG: glutamine--tRNA ligase/YqeY domain fusion protein [Hydrogenophaga sp.]|uniref:glutamine--tRNA ligase/YqeY domain fusion protein n=1 Tax=Hydrogenophaga sp. TaxID=1904254 RepID=UPI00271B8158|nr:glutamine--tRNA ligase/YqeY domain fusion protein [Hydrogenophaga sp.]MDO9146585.1 glutamine--tRNA ligase/YqeY domain fusion protein [Hydrogenophaga sp.]MDO9606713.1 glutamine--tRNA ligase/YqeY domain fusion protein [Hydrogenophaga sp.]